MDQLSIFSNFNFIIPELFIICSALFLLAFGVYKNNNNTLIINYLSSSVVIIAMFLLYLFSQGSFFAFNDMFISNKFIFIGKLIILLSVFLSLVIYAGFIEHRSKIKSFEYSILMLLSTSGMLLMISANDLLNLYMSLELQSLPLYILAAFNRDNTKSTEAGIKYFTLGALSSGLLLFGISLIYGYTGSISFPEIQALITQNIAQNVFVPGIVIGMVLLGIGLCFKISAVPFHMWTPDVYQGSPTPVTAFFAIAPKLAALILLFRVFNDPFIVMEKDWSQFISFMAVASMVLGSIAALQQKNIKRLLAYSSITHVGYMLLAVLVGTDEAFMMMLFYFSIYIFASIGMFATILIMSKDAALLEPDTSRVEHLSDLSGLANRYPILAFTIMVFMLSLAGIPPLAGFFAKFYLFAQAVKGELYILAVVAVLSSVVAAFYYLRIIKIMYFDKGSNTLTLVKSSALSFLIVLCVFVNLFFIFLIHDWSYLFNSFLNTN